MKSALMRRLEKVEGALNWEKDHLVVVTPVSWGSLKDEELNDRIARWRAGENFGNWSAANRGLAGVYQDGMRSDLDIADRQRARILTLGWGK